MVDETARPVALAGERRPWPLIAIALGFVAVAVLAVLIGPPLILFAGCVVSGFGITYLSSIALTFEERLVFGTVIGAMAVASLSFVLSMIERDVTVATVLIAIALALVAGCAAAYRERHLLAADWSDARLRWSASPRSPTHPWPLAAIFVVCGAWTVHFLHQALVYQPDGLYAGYINIWGDWAAHLSFAGSFAYGHNFPPEFPIDPGNHLGYPFMMDFLAANVVPLGSGLAASLVLTSGLLGLAFPAVMYLVAARFAGGRAAGAIAVAVFLLSGGLGFVYLISAIDAHGFGILAHIPREYTLNRDLNYQWLNPVLAYLVPQRSTLFGFSLALIALVLVWLAVREKLGWQAFLFVGILTGLTPAFHVHAYGTIVALSAFWAAFNRRREWIAFFVPALVLALPVIAWMLPAAPNCSYRASDQPLCMETGWLSYTDWKRDGAAWFAVDFAWFWIKNTSFLIPLILAAHLLNRWIPTRFATWFTPMWLWFIVPSIFILQPWEWDNTKFFVFFAIFGSIMAGGVLAAMFKRGPEAKVLAAATLVLLVLSGALDVARASDYSLNAYQLADARGVQVADWVRANTPPDAVFVTWSNHNNAIPMLSGRRILVGYPGWLSTYGLPDYMQKGIDAKLILDGDPSTPALVRQYGISYIVIGPPELTEGANNTYWSQHGTLVYDNGEYRVYRV